MPEFANVTVERCLTKIGRQSNEVEQTVKRIEKYANSLLIAEEKPTITEFVENVFGPLEEANDRLRTTWSLAKMLYLSNKSMMPAKTYMVIHQRANRAQTSQFHSLFMYKAISEMKTVYSANKEWTKEHERLFDMFILEARLNGVTLDEVNSEKLKTTLFQLSEEKITFESKINVAIDKFSHTIKEYDAVRSYPAALLQTMSGDPSNYMVGPWKVSLKPYIYEGFMKYCPDRFLRWNVWQANTRKTSRQISQELDNSQHIETIRECRHAEATLLGYENYAQMSMETKMVGSVERAKQFINEMRSFAWAAQVNEMKCLNEFALKSGFTGTELEQYDIAYWKRKYNVSACKYDDNVIEDYFQLNYVVEQMFALSENLFAIKIVDCTEGTSRWHRNVRFYRVYNTSQNPLRTDSSSPIAEFYLNFCPLIDEPLGNTFGMPTGWTINIRPKCARTNQTPLLSILYNFSDDDSKPLSLVKVQTLFRKFGSALQELLTEVHFSELSGRRNIEWDASNLCSDVFENLLYRSDVLKSISKHKITGQALSDELIESIQRQRLTLAGYHLCEKLFVSALDLELYTTQKFWLDIFRELWPQYYVHKIDKRDARVCSMLDIFSRYFAAGYYGFVWSEMMAADIALAFDEGPKTKSAEENLAIVGQRFRKTFLASGGSRHQMELFRQFRGRDPSTQALVKKLRLEQIKC